MFIYRCKKDTEAEVIKTHLVSKGLKIKSVEMKSHKDAHTRSFRVCVESTVDFDNLMTGEHIPPYVKVRRFVHFRHQNSDKGLWGNASDEPSVVNDIISSNESVSLNIAHKISELNKLEGSVAINVNGSLASGKHNIMRILQISKPDETFL